MPLARLPGVAPRGPSSNRRNRVAQQEHRRDPHDEQELQSMAQRIGALGDRAKHSARHPDQRRRGQAHGQPHQQKVQHQSAEPGPARS